MKNITKLITIIISLLVATSMISAAASDQIYKNIRVQEKILNTILEDETDYSVENDIKGLYLEGLGAIFTVNVSEGYEAHFNFNGFNNFNMKFSENIFALDMDDFDMSWVSEEDEDDEEDDDEEDEKDSNDEPQVSKEDLEKERQEKLEEFHDLIKNYISDYGPLIDIPESEIMIIKVKMENSIFNTDNDEEYEYSVSGKNLSKSRKGKLDRKKLYQSIDRKNAEDSGNSQRDIKIMRNILNTVISPETNGSMVNILSGNGSWETYIPGYGVVFFDDVSTGLHFFADTGIWTSSGHNTIIIDDDGHHESKGENHKDLEADVSELMASYATTLKSLKNDENMVVALKMDDDSDEDEPGLIILKLNKSDIDKYSNSVEDLKSKINVTKI
ncbi:MAG: hypothetical protein HN729_07215 [Candidatus Marinimicrobia bacterium]|jgi:hypothetical protein|nr:hypothetical protein [Candidatus Neomarinimicrobiota bacterium]MBT3633586.1 hypothetical protein [Candidatus Neomarinimicrobiota bacterium]MBT3682461.1 hypothetical protein [Candidatus Neomarinimicrobiota bacterium]MBT3759225.1 hypothetical protein [Candidatus Neomarinimicrobiota bacterium]MBT3895502.1 hypothetical protein [Candidatus Neomarinimicrobiota bacterium]